MRSLLLIAAAVGGLSLVALASAGDPEPKPTLVDPLPFDHSAHNAEFDRLQLACMDCHAFGDPAPPKTLGDPKAAPVEREPFVDESIPVNLAICHGCHRGEATRASEGAPGACATCHPNADELLPDSHGPSWIHDHAPEARSLLAECSECHQRSVCVDCHEARGALARSPHDVGFRSLHGIEARLDPSNCATCHTAETCTTCHTTGATPW